MANRRFGDWLGIKRNIGQEYTGNIKVLRMRLVVSLIR